MDHTPQSQTTTAALGNNHTPPSVVFTQWIVTDPFRGYPDHALLTMSDGTQALDHHQSGVEGHLATLDQRSQRIVTREILDTLQTAYYASRCTPPGLITEQRWHDMLGVLPPSRWTRGRVELFHISERLIGNIVTWFGHYRGTYWEWEHFDDTITDDLETAVIAAYGRQQALFPKTPPAIDPCSAAGSPAHQQISH